MSERIRCLRYSPKEIIELQTTKHGGRAAKLRVQKLALFGEAETGTGKIEDCSVDKVVSELEQVLDAGDLVQNEVYYANSRCKTCGAETVDCKLRVFKVKKGTAK